MDTERSVRPDRVGPKKTFIQVREEINLLKERLRDITISEESKNRVDQQMEDAKERLQELIRDMHNQGAFDNVEARYKALVGLKQEGRLTWEILLEELRFVSVADDHFGLSKEDPHFGMIGWYYQVRLDKLMTFEDSS